MICYPRQECALPYYTNPSKIPAHTLLLVMADGELTKATKAAMEAKEAAAANNNKS